MALRSLAAVALLTLLNACGAVDPPDTELGGGC